MNVVLSDKRASELVHIVVQGIRALILLVAGDSSNREVNARVLIVDAIDGFSIFQGNKKVIAIATKQLLNSSEFLEEVQFIIDQKISKRNTIASSKIEERRRQRRNKLIG